MSIRKTAFVNNEFYHIYNRGVDKRNVVSNNEDSDRFLKSILFFNSKKPIGSIYEKTFQDKHQLGGETAKLSRSSWDEYLGNKKSHSFCSKGIIMSQFKNINEYKVFAEDSLKEILRKKEEEQISKIILE